MTLPTPLIIFLASYLNWLMLLSLIYLVNKGKRRVVVLSVVTVGAAWGAAVFFQTVVPLPRPYQILGVKPLVSIFGLDRYSFPSGHAAATFALAFSILPEAPLLGAALLVGAGLVSLGRVLASVHYWRDILGGIILALLTTGLLRRLFK